MVMIYFFRLLLYFKSKTMREFHDRFTVPLFGFNDWRQFYKEASLHGKLHKVKVPTLILNAADDPFSPYNCKYTNRNCNIGYTL